MLCITCNHPAQAVCNFCGRAVCKQHIKTDLFVSGYSGKSGAWNLDVNAVRVTNAVCCGLCDKDYRGTA